MGETWVAPEGTTAVTERGMSKKKLLTKRNGRGGIRGAWGKNTGKATGYGGSSEWFRA